MANNEVQIVVTSKDKTDFEAPRKSAEKYGQSMDHLGERVDKSEQRVLGMKDTVDGVATIMKGPGKQGIAAYLQGWADLVSGLANFVIPALAAGVKATAANTVANIRGAASATAKKAAELASAVATRAVTAAQWALNVALRANPIGIVVTVIALVVAALVRWYMTSQRARDIINGAFHSVVAAGQALWNGLRASWEAIRALWERVTSIVASAARSGFLGPIPLILSRWHEVIDFFKALPGKLAGAMSGLGQALIDKFSGAVKRVLEFLGIRSPSKVFEGIGHNLVAGLANGIAGRIKQVPNLFATLASKAGGIFGIGGHGGGGGGGGSAKGLVGNAAAAFEQMHRMFPSLTIGGWRAQGSVPGSDHPKGLALDVMTGAAHVAAQIISAFRGESGAKYWIWNRQIAQASNGWNPQPYHGPSPHTDHVHLSYYQQGTSYVPNDGPAYLHRGEAVISAAQNRNRGGGGVVLEVHSGGTHLDDLLVEVLRKAVRVRGGDVQTALGR